MPFVTFGLRPNVTIYVANSLFSLFFVSIFLSFSVDPP